MDIELWKQRKKELNMTFDELSKLSNIPITTLKNIFRGVTKAPRIDTVNAINSALGADTYSEENMELFGEAPFINATLNDDENAAVHAFRQLGLKKGAKAQYIMIALMYKLMDDKSIAYQDQLLEIIEKFTQIK